MDVGSDRIVVDVRLTHDVVGSNAAGTFPVSVSYAEEVGFLVMASSSLKCQCLACLHQLRLLDAAIIAAIANDHRNFSSFSLWTTHD